jgi:hypothetical protein
VIERGICGGTRLSRPVASVDEEKVLPAVAVGIEECDAGTKCFGKVFLAERSARVTEMNAGAGRHVIELGECRGWLCAVRRHDNDTCGERCQNESCIHVCAIGELVNW